MAASPGAHVSRWRLQVSELRAERDGRTGSVPERDTPEIRNVGSSDHVDESAEGNLWSVARQRYVIVGRRAGLTGVPGHRRGRRDPRDGRDVGTVRALSTCSGPRETHGANGIARNVRVFPVAADGRFGYGNEYLARHVGAPSWAERPGRARLEHDRRDAVSACASRILC